MVELDWDSAKISFRSASAVFKRDMKVFWKEIRGNLIRILGQPLFFLIVFGLLLPEMRIFRSNYVEILVPGIMAITAITGSMRSVGGEIALSLDHNEEIRSHILLPLSMKALSIEKIIYGTFQGVFSGLAVLGISLILFSDTISITPLSLLGLIGVFVIGGLTFGGLGLAIGSTFTPPEIMFEVMFVIMMPMMFFGATFYPISEIVELGKIFYYFTLGIPLTYISESIRMLLIPETSYLSINLILSGLLISFIVFVPLGIIAFKKRVIS
ncbi:MAG: ABC-type multidrug transport system permease component [Candidatus Methanohalarchaeum thermophilum]|uniref:ABC-type multidrug transport system permease component n=1 Tax=Methanohalarchaeum thermophilum TaxID=1903181 RepID=A0A1Q6DU76_METT1|nr:MAG: ABC-type multidrug transport system permease component [Candidatus Methanohalarchaeum thermophilum]